MIMCLVSSSILLPKVNRPTGFLDANKKPLRIHEDILVFYRELPTYNPQKKKGDKNHSVGNTERVNNNYGDFKKVESDLSGLKYPNSILNFEKEHPSKFHPTQKPVSLFEYLIKTYSNEDDVVLDNCMGSGTAGVACVNTKRNFIGIEKEEKYYEISEKRIEIAKRKHQVLLF